MFRITAVTAPAAFLICLTLAPAGADKEADVEALKKFGGEVREEIPGSSARTAEFWKNPKLSDADLRRAAEHLCRVPDLRGLALDYTRVTDAGLESLGELATLERLSLKATRVTNGGLKRLAALRPLRSVDLRLAAVTPDGVAAFRKARPDVKVKASGSGEPADEAARLRGRWRAVRSEEDGKARRDAGNRSLVISGNDMALFDEGRLVFLCRFSLDPDSKPKGGRAKLTDVPPGFNSRGDGFGFLYEVGRDRLMLCLGSLDRPDERPRELSGKAGNLLVLEREKE